MNSIFARMVPPEHFLRLLLALGIALAGGLGSLPATATSVTPLSLTEIVRGVDAIVVGTITDHQSRWGDASKCWMQTDYTLAVEDAVYPSEQSIPIRQTIVLTYWGGTIDGETQDAAGVRLPVNGERLLVMLHSSWAQTGMLAPTMGFDQGLFAVVVDAASGRLVMRDATGEPLALTRAGQIVLGNVTAPDTTALDLATFTAWLRANIGSIKAAPAAPKPTVDLNDPRIMKTFAKTPALPGSGAPTSANVTAPALGHTAEVGAGVPAATEALPAPATGVAEVMANRAKSAPVTPKWSSTHRWQSLPIVVNQFPINGTFSPWSPEDQYQLAKWNYYDDVFRVYVTPTNTLLWADGVNDLAGWLTDAETFSMYGAHLACGAGCQVLGVTYRRWNGSGWLLEGDIVLNAAVAYTLDDEWAWDGGAATTFRQTMIHEMGHLHGLDHNFTFFALMNYFNPSNRRFFAIPFLDDTTGIRGEYPSNAVARTDLAVYPYYQSSSPVMTEPRFSIASLMSRSRPVSPTGLVLWLTTITWKTRALRRFPPRPSSGTSRQRATLVQPTTTSARPRILHCPPTPTSRPLQSDVR